MDLTREQNERVRAALRALLLQHGGQELLACRLGLKQPTLSKFLAGHRGTSRAVAAKVAKLAGMGELDLLNAQHEDGPALVEFANEDSGVAISFQGPDGHALTLLMPRVDFHRFRRCVNDFRPQQADDPEPDDETLGLPRTTCLWAERRKAG